MKSEIQPFLQYNQTYPAATGAQQPPGYFRSRTALCSLGRDLLFCRFNFLLLYSALQNYFISHTPRGLYSWIIPQCCAVPIKMEMFFLHRAAIQ